MINPHEFVALVRNSVRLDSCVRCGLREDKHAPPPEADSPPEIVAAQSSLQKEK